MVLSKVLTKCVFLSYMQARVGEETKNHKKRNFTGGLMGLIKKHLLLLLSCLSPSLLDDSQYCFVVYLGFFHRECKKLKKRQQIPSQGLLKYLFNLVQNNTVTYIYSKIEKKA